ncbi:DnaB-like helicase C-terminal domain-containing protein [Microbacterium sp. ARD31]|uniref:DnaB-like helicase C-terminal domain-containing protein n=1 Tax=Microbacterium sp. ARD31 TaxID=2962576 RepID=UPI002881AC0E|nr:DnaB-like helicase C-terminal domain-containing protein [Microbacterium sp. ARD31]MDT0183662.1 DnaB-like helicase C-terminal domain-containing protein [Microbacterium sp. ARD31]
MDHQLMTVGASLARSDERMLTGRNAAGRVWKTGFAGLDPLIGGGMRAGSLLLLAGPQGLGKSTFALQMARNNAATGRPVLYFSYEHDAEDLTQKLIAMEAGELDESDQVRVNSIRSIFDDLWVSSLEHRLESVPSGVDALKRVEHYSEHLFVHRSTGTRTDLAAIQAAIEAVRQHAGTTPLVVVDYLQKVKSTHLDEETRSTEIVEGLKDLAIDISAPILAIAAADKDALRTGKRMRASDLRGSSALAYEADVVMVLNNKYDIVARHHLTYDLTNAERFKDYAVLTVEKNRFGRDGVTLQFRTRFDQGRYEPEGFEVKEQLIDERVFRE